MAGAGVFLRGQAPEKNTLGQPDKDARHNKEKKAVLCQNASERV